MTQSHAFLWKGFNFTSGAEISEKDLPGPLSKHLRALRIREGELVCFLDGAGSVIEAKCLSPKPYAFRVESLKTEGPRTPQIHLYLSPPRRETLSQTISQATEIGVDLITLLATDHNDYSVKEHGPLSERAQRILEASVEQCRAAYLPKLFINWLSPAAAVASMSGPAFFADEDLSRERHLGPRGDMIGLQGCEVVSLFVGPEGGWSAAERALFESHPHVIPMGLGPQILKVPTACVAALYHIRLLTMKLRC